MLSRPTDVRDPAFIAKLTLFVNQQGQDTANQKVHDEWQVTANNWVLRNEQNRVLNLPIDPPLTLPTMTLYHDDGVVDHPPFPDLRVPVLVPPANPTPAHGIADDPDKVPPDRTDAILLTLGTVMSDLDKIKAFLGIK